MLEWQPLYHPALIDYVVYYASDPNLRPSEWNRLVVEPKEPRPGVIISSLDSDTIFYITVSALYSNGEGPTSAVHQVRTASNQVQPLRPPGELRGASGKSLPQRSHPKQS